MTEGAITSRGSQYQWRTDRSVGILHCTTSGKALYLLSTRHSLTHSSLTHHSLQASSTTTTTITITTTTVVVVVCKAGLGLTDF